MPEPRPAARPALGAGSNDLMRPSAPPGPQSNAVSAIDCGGGQVLEAALDVPLVGAEAEHANAQREGGAVLDGQEGAGQVHPLAPVDGGEEGGVALVPGGQRLAGPASQAEGHQRELGAG